MKFFIYGEDAHDAKPTRDFRVLKQQEEEELQAGQAYSKHNAV